MAALDLRSDETRERDDERHAFAGRRVADERERCAKIAEAVGNDYWATYIGGEITVVKKIADAIRSGIPVDLRP